MPNSEIPTDAPISEEEKERLIAENLQRKLELPVVKISLGCGLHWKTPFEEWINIDGLKNDHTDLVCEFGSIPLPDKCADFLELGDTIEHIVPWRRDEILKEWFRIVKIGGKIRIGTPNFHRSMTQYTLHTLFGKLMPNGWLDITCKDSIGETHSVKYHIMGSDVSPLEQARRNIYAWGTNAYEQHYHLYTMETLTEVLEQFGFGDIDFSDSPPQELNDPRNSWWFSLTATKLRNV